jgi:hypothetical protein
MNCVLLAKSAVLLDLHAVWHVLLLFGGVVVTLFALGASKCDLCTHNRSSISRLADCHLPCRKILREKNRPQISR